MDARLIKSVPASELDSDSRQDILDCLDAAIGWADANTNPEAVLKGAEIPLWEMDVSEIYPLLVSAEDLLLVHVYANRMREGASFPPVVVVDDVLCEGYHRYYASLEAGVTRILSWDLSDIVKEMRLDDANYGPTE